MSIKFHKPTWYSKLVAIIVVSAIIPIISFYIGTQYEKMIEDTIDLQSTVASLPAVDGYQSCISHGGRDISPQFNGPKLCQLENKLYELNCVVNDKYVVVGKSSEDLIGTDIVVKSKEQIIDSNMCTYSRSENDFFIRNQDAEYIMALEGTHLILDNGTAPGPRGLEIYDIQSRKKVFGDSYLRPISINDGEMTYWSPSTTEATEDNCDKYEEYTAAGLYPEISKQVSLDLSTMKRTETGQEQCYARS